MGDQSPRVRACLPDVLEREGKDGVQVRHFLLFIFHGARRSRLQAGYLQQLAFLETTDSWAPGKAFTISLLFAL